MMNKLLIIPDYRSLREEFAFRNHIVAGRTVKDWLTPISTHACQVERLIWNLLHLCLALNKIWENVLVEKEKLKQLLQLSRCLDPRLHQCVGEKFLSFFYHFSVGRYGHQEKKHLYFEEISELLIYSEHSHGATVFEFIPDFDRVKVPFPFRFHVIPLSEKI
eukprot:gb/GEZJ01005822.1/.p1 GENE.gb/GEZJ01005822.1/~~gb/GEZJ01005822.1/.p1  ORF type:complete len:162 (+),score=8.39 gb/GEZJ01005822.1/:1106-1591(+)